MRERFWGWLKKNLGIMELAGSVATGAQLGGTAREVVVLAGEVEKLRLAVADLREQLDMDPMVELRKELDDYRVPRGDPQLGS